MMSYATKALLLFQQAKRILSGPWAKQRFASSAIPALCMYRSQNIKHNKPASISIVFAESDASRNSPRIRSRAC